MVDDNQVLLIINSPSLCLLFFLFLFFCVHFFYFFGCVLLFVSDIGFWLACMCRVHTDNTYIEIKCFSEEMSLMMVYI